MGEKNTRGCGRQYTITRGKKIARYSDRSKTAESSLETKVVKKRKRKTTTTKKPNKINKNAETLGGRLALILRILIQIF